MVSCLSPALPDEQRGFFLGKRNLGQDNLGPSDDPDNEVGDLTEAFDYDRLKGEKPPIPSSSAAFTLAQIKTLPHLATPNYSTNGYTNGACEAIGVLPTDFETFADYKNGKPIDPYPNDVNPRPTAVPRHADFGQLDALILPWPAAPTAGLEAIPDGRKPQLPSICLLDTAWKDRRCFAGLPDFSFLASYRSAPLQTRKRSRRSKLRATLIAARCKASKIGTERTSTAIFPRSEARSAAPWRSPFSAVRRDFPFTLTRPSRRRWPR